MAVLAEEFAAVFAAVLMAISIAVLMAVLMAVPIAALMATAVASAGAKDVSWRGSGQKEQGSGLAKDHRCSPQRPDNGHLGCCGHLGCWGLCDELPTGKAWALSCCVFRCLCAFKAFSHLDVVFQLLG